jgi:hypothetical protein
VLWGYKTTAIFDVWSFEHILSGLSVGHIVKKHHHKLFTKLLGKDHEYHSWHFNLTGVLCVAFAWEALEHYLETGLAGFTVAYWFQGVEFWPNRLISDPLMLVLGYVIAKRYPSLIIPARVASFLWLFLHIFVFPHSMYLQQFI